MDGDDGVARRAAVDALLALRLEPDRLAVLDAGRDGHFERAARRQAHTLRRALHALGERDGDGGLHILATDRRARLLAEAARAAAAAWAAAAAEDIGEDVGRIEAASPPRAPAALAAAEIELEMLGAAAAAAPGTAARKALEAGEARLALGIDLAAVELAAFLLVAEDLVGRADLGEAVLRLRLLALVGVVLAWQGADTPS